MGGFIKKCWRIISESPYLGGFAPFLYMPKEAQISCEHYYFQDSCNTYKKKKLYFKYFFATLYLLSIAHLPTHRQLTHWPNLPCRLLQSPPNKNSAYTTSTQHTACSRVIAAVMHQCCLCSCIYILTVYCLIRLMVAATMPVPLMA